MPGISNSQARAIGAGSAALGAIGALLALRIRHHWAQGTQDDDEIDAELLAWLSSQGLGRYACQLARHGYDDLELLRELSASEVDEMIHAVPLRVGHAVKLRKCLARLRGAGVEAGANADTAGTGQRDPQADIMNDSSAAASGSGSADAVQPSSALPSGLPEAPRSEPLQATSCGQTEGETPGPQDSRNHGDHSLARNSPSSCLYAPACGGAAGGSSSSQPGTNSTVAGTSLAVGSAAVLHGLAKRPELNGRVGTLTAWDEQAGRWEFAFGDRGTIKVRDENVRPVPTPGPTRVPEALQVPDEFRCCITQDMMERPVITSDGHTYERTAIAKWLEEHNTSPKTGQELPDTVLRPNHALRAQILAWRERQGLPPLPPWEPEPQETVQPQQSGGQQSSETMHTLMVQTPAGSITVPLAQVQVNNGTTTIVGNEAWLTQLLQTNAALRSEISSAWQQEQPAEQVTPPDVEQLARTVMREPRLLEMVMQWLHNDPDAQRQVPILAGHGLQASLHQAAVESPLFRAAREGETGVVEQLLGPNALDRFQRDLSAAGDSLLHVASWCGHLRLVVMLLARGHPIHMPSRNRSTPLHYASWRGHTDVVRQLLEARAETERKMMGGDTALHQAAWQDHPDVLALLLENRAAANATKDNGDSALALAAVRGHYRSCRELLMRMTENDAIGDAVSTCLSRRNSSGRSPLHAAASSGDVQVAKLLLEAAASANARSNNDETPLHHAVQVGSASAAAALLEARAEVDVPRLEDDHTPLHLAILSGRASIIPILVEHGATLSSSTSRRDGMSPMHMAAMHEATTQRQEGAVSVISALAEARAELEARSRTGLTPLHVVLGQYPQVAPRRSTALRLLLQHRADVEALHESGDRPLHVAVSTNLRVEAAILLECRAQVNATSKDGSTPLHIAAQHGARECAEILLRAGANAGACNEVGQTPEDVANQHGLVNVAQLLRRHDLAAYSDRQASSTEQAVTPSNQPAA